MSETDDEKENKKLLVMFLSPSDSVRSQMAKGILRSKYGDHYEVFTSGTDPKEVHPVAIEVMQEIDIDISEQHSDSHTKSLGEKVFDYVVSIYDDKVELSPSFPEGKNYTHLNIRRPPRKNGEKDLKPIFRRIRDDIYKYIEENFDPTAFDLERLELEAEAEPNPRPQKLLEKREEEGPIEEYILDPIEKKISLRATSGFLLISSFVVGLILSNILGSVYLNFWEHPIGIAIGDFELILSVKEWINEGLMTLFFFMIGLEIKREAKEGILSSFEEACLPIMAAAGGMIFPGIIFILFNLQAGTTRGWAIPITTDVALALTVLLLLGAKVKDSSRIFLMSYAVADAIGGILVIAVFYAEGINWLAGLIGIGFILIAFVLNSLKIQRSEIYTLIGIGAWIAFLYSGISPVLAGVLLAFTIPLKPKIDQSGFIQTSWETLEEYKNATETDSSDRSNTTEEVDKALFTLQRVAREATSTLSKLEEKLNEQVHFLVLPIFALANSGIVLTNTNLLQNIFQPIPIGIIVGIFGKIIGISLFSYIGCCISKFCELPENMNFRELFGAAILGGIGFTSAIFVTELAYYEELFIIQSKLGILISSILAAIFGYLWLYIDYRFIEKNRDVE
ncbi:MAG: Na+/H+ antiporter NhaA [Candidatus Lokiarchaeota archaeon]|nr:Na+/H+ antiporter NhaA [Candidatus Lokiarchaeota archaeon]